MRLPIASFYPASLTNQTAGRGGNSVDRITIHHTAANNNTLRYLWADPARNGSSHFFVSGTVIEQYVDTDNTAWTNGNFASNQKSISIEVNGDWRNGYYNQSTLNNLQKLLVELRRNYPTARITYHMDESKTTTLCPADLKHKGYALTVWNNAGAILQPKPPVPAPITYKAITPKKVILIRDSNLWNFNFTSWATAKAVGSYPTGHVVDVVAEATNQLGAKYYMTAYSYNNGAVRATNGFNVADVKNYVAPVLPTPPKPEPVPPKPPVVVPTPPPVPPVAPPNPDSTAVVAFLTMLRDLITAFLSKFKK